MLAPTVAVFIMLSQSMYPKALSCLSYESVVLDLTRTNQDFAMTPHLDDRTGLKRSEAETAHNGSTDADETVSHSRDRGC
jgi:hypothetical protein